MFKSPARDSLPPASRQNERLRPGARRGRRGGDRDALVRPAAGDGRRSAARGSAAASSTPPSAARPSSPKPASRWAAATAPRPVAATSCAPASARPRCARPGVRSGGRGPLAPDGGATPSRPASYLRSHPSGRRSVCGSAAGRRRAWGVWPSLLRPSVSTTRSLWGLIRPAPVNILHLSPQLPRRLGARPASAGLSDLRPPTSPSACVSHRRCRATRARIGWLRSVLGVAA
jgi:hypothetical protein